MTNSLPDPLPNPTQGERGQTLDAVSRVRHLFVDRIDHAEPKGAGYAEYEQRFREAFSAGREIRIEAGKRDEYPIPQGHRAVVYVLEGSVRFEGDDTPAEQGDTVWFRPAPREGGEALVGVQADAPFRGVLVSEPARGVAAG